MKIKYKKLTRFSNIEPSKFLKDIEEQYDDKLGFESKVKEKRRNFSN